MGIDYSKCIGLYALLQRKNVWLIDDFELCLKEKEIEYGRDLERN